MCEKQDRRVKYTKALLRGALVELMQTQHISRISVKALCETADVHRSTFYTHYKDQYDLLEQIEREVFDNVKRYLYEEDFDSQLPISVQKINRILKYGKQNADVLAVLLSENSDISFARDIMVFLDIASLAKDETIDARTKEYAILFGVHGCLSIITKWLQDGMREPTMQIAELVVQMVFEGVSGFKGPDETGASTDTAET